MTTKRIKLGEYCNIEKGKTGIKKAIPGDYPMVVTAEERITNNSYDFDCKAVIIPLVSSTGHGHASINRLHYQEGKFALGTILAAVIVKDEKVLDPRFLFIYLSYFKDQLLVPLMKGSANVSLNINKISNVEIILPSIEKQKKIIKIEKENQKISKLEDEIKIQKDQVFKLRKLILQNAFLGQLTKHFREDSLGVESLDSLIGKIEKEKTKRIKNRRIKPLPVIAKEEIQYALPSTWRLCRLGEISYSNAGKTLHKGVNSGKFRDYITTSNLYWEGFKLDNIKKIQVEEKEIERCTATKGDLLICEGGDVGRSAIWDKDYDICFQNHIHRVRPYGGIESRYIYFYMMYLYMTDKIKRHKKGMGIGNLSGEALSLIPLPLCSIAEQKLIVEKIQLLFKKISLLEESIEQSIYFSKMVMSSILKTELNK